jgi:hypothetical protein
MPIKQQAAISATRVRYIKLGEGGSWEKECLDKGIIRFGFGSANAERFPLCRARKWDVLRKTFLSEPRTSKGTATRFTNETRIFFEDDGSTLWITFVGEQLCWGFLTAGPPQPHTDGARSATRPRATPSYSVAAMTSAVRETPSMSSAVTRQERIGTKAKDRRTCRRYCSFAYSD